MVLAPVKHLALSASNSRAVPLLCHPAVRGLLRALEADLHHVARRSLGNLALCVLGTVIEAQRVSHAPLR